MRIAIVGSGAIGSLFGARLSAHGCDVILQDGWQQQVDTINTKGVKLISPQGEEVITNIRAISNIPDIGERDLIFIFVKAYDNEAVMKEVQTIVTKNTHVITLQNGLGNAETIASFIGVNNTIVGVISQGGMLVAPGVTERRSFGVTNIANLNGKQDAFLKELARILNEAGFETHSKDNVDSLLWSKLLVNVAINALASITRLPNNLFAEMPEGEKLIAMVLQEACCICDKKGIKTKYENPIAEVITWLKHSKNRNSMLSDVLKHRKTEIDTINGAIVRIGKEYGIPTPANEMVTLLVRIIEQHYEDMIISL